MEKEVVLRAFEQGDLKQLHRWLNDPESILMVGRTPMTFVETEQYVQKMRNENALILGIENKEQDLVGWIHLTKLYYEHGRAEIGLLIAPESRGHGYGKYAMENMITLAFNQLRLNKVYLTTRGLNKRALGLYEKLGFTVEGTLRQHSFINGKYYDTLFMGVLADEWKKSRVD